MAKFLVRELQKRASPGTCKHGRKENIHMDARETAIAQGHMSTIQSYLQPHSMPI
jgi:hypothetical protein